MRLSTFIAYARRVPTVKQRSFYHAVLPEELLADLLADAWQQHKYLADSEGIVLAACSLGTGGNMARYACLKAGLPLGLPATTLDTQCVGFYDALRLGQAYINSGQGSWALIGGMESNSLAPSRFYQTHDPRFQANEPFQNATFSPLEAGNDLLTAADRVAKTYEISEGELISQCLESHRRAFAALQSGVLSPFILPVHNAADNVMKPPHVLQKLVARLATSGSIHALTTAHYTDGASLVLLVSDSLAKQLANPPLARLHKVVVQGAYPPAAPAALVPATEKLLQNSPGIEHFDCVEVNESFAVKPLIFQKKFGLADENLNIFGGNLAYGHPFAASGGQNLIHLLAALLHSSGQHGLVTAAAAGGIGAAAWIERV